MNPNRVTIVQDDGLISVDGRAFLGLDMSLLDPQIHALQWYGQRGEIEMKGDATCPPCNIEITSLAPFADVLAVWQAAADAEDAPPTIRQIADRRIAALSADCEAAIVSGFISNALGAPHRYQSDRDDQVNLVGAATAGVDMPFKCSDEDGVWAYRLHSSAQLQQVLADGARVKLGYLQRFATLRAQVEAVVADATREDAEQRIAIEGVVW